jgi:hypothetical protein
MQAFSAAGVRQLQAHVNFGIFSGTNAIRNMGALSL